MVSDLHMNMRRNWPSNEQKQKLKKRGLWNMIGSIRISSCTTGNGKVCNAVKVDGTGTAIVSPRLDIDIFIVRCRAENAKIQ